MRGGPGIRWVSVADGPDVIQVESRHRVEEVIGVRGSVGIRAAHEEPAHAVPPFNQGAVAITVPRITDRPSTLPGEGGHAVQPARAGTIRTWRDGPRGPIKVLDER